MDAYEAWERHDAEQERWLQRRPVCNVCGEHIQDDHLFDIDGDLVCEECLKDYMEEHYKQSTEKYMEGKEC